MPRPHGGQYASQFTRAPRCAARVLMTGQHQGHTRVRGNAGKANPQAQAAGRRRHRGRCAPQLRLPHGARRQVGLGDEAPPTAACRASAASTTSSATSASITHTIISPISCGGMRAREAPNVVTPVAKTRYATQAKVYARPVCRRSLRFVAENRMTGLPLTGHGRRTPTTSARLLADGPMCPTMGQTRTGPPRTGRAMITR